MAEIQRPTAEIIPFPFGGRSNLRWAQEKNKAVQPTAAAASTDLAFGGSWYHEAALSEQDKPNSH